MRLSRLLPATALLGMAFLASPAVGHPLDPALLEIRQSDEVIEVLWRVPAEQPRGAPLEPRLPPCEALSTPTVQRDAQRITWRVELDCGALPLVGATLGVSGLAERQTEALVRVRFADGRSAQTVLRGEKSSWVVPDVSSALAIGKSYLRLGVEHILGGLDHLLFVLGLLFLVRGRKALLLTVTAFTVGHSLTLALAVLGWVRLPSAPVEVAIALSIWILALRIASGPSAHRRLAWPIALVFGWLHGLGFAGALGEAGLPAGDIPLALLAFNLGIEIGQVAFIAAALGIVALASRLPVLRGAGPLEERLALPASYVIGVLSTYWILQRSWAWWAVGG